MKQEINNLSTIAYEKIKDMIIKKDILPGERILQEEMAVKLGISKIPVIQALGLLSKEGLVKSIPKKGYAVVKFSDKEYREALELRRVIESFVVSEIASHDIDPVIKKKILRFQGIFEEYFGRNDIKRYFDTDKKFHYFLIDISGNSLFKKIYEDNNILFITFLRGLHSMEVSYEHHKEMINGIINKDVKKVVKFLVKNISSEIKES